MSKPRSATSRTSSVLTTALVASGTKAGVRTSPWASFSVPVRAEPARVWISKEGVTAASEPSRDPRSGSLPLDGALAGAVDGDPARLALLGLGDADLEHAAVEAGGHGLGVDALGQGQRAAERAGGALDADVALAGLLVLGLALTRDGQRRVL